MTYRTVPVKSHAVGDQFTDLFIVKNSNDNRVYVLAIDANSAFSMAQARRHVLCADSATVYRVHLDKLATRNPKFAASIRHATKSRIQGIVEDKSGFAVIDEKVFTPITEV